ncbi:MAG: TIGR03619 family F420-dependent LLM class oxidoreductase [Chloroflexi bacterium]|nr:TIGR03619 family F420-dependent LLM class oxidoreductase [Chloroflexota bacterium]
MKVGVWIPSVRRMASRDTIRQSILQAERLGYDSLWTIDHVISPVANAAQFGLLYDPLVVMGYAAAITERIQIGVSVLVLPYRHGVLTAKMVASLDDLSNGRIVLGVGAGWNAEESRILGLPFDERGPMTDEYIAIMRELWANPAAKFDGRYTRFSDVEFRPRPAQAGGPPIWVGGSSRAALRRTVEHGDAWHPINRTPAQLREGKADILKLCERFGRATPPTLTLRIDARVVLDDQPYPKPAHAGHVLAGTPSELVDQIAELREIGIEHLSLEFVGRDFADFTAQVDAFAEKVRPHL